MRAGLAHSIRFDPADPGASLSGLPQAPAVFALCAADPAAEPYLSKTPNLRRRLMRFLRGPQGGVASRRLQLAHMVDHIDYSVTGSDFESSLCLYAASVRGRSGGCVYALQHFCVCRSRIRILAFTPQPRSQRRRRTLSSAPSLPA